MYPEAGGSSSFARHAFNELVSFIAAWGQMLNYVITVAISAFFIPHYLAVFWEPLGEGPGDVIGGIVLIAALAALNVKGTEESSRLNLVLAIADLLTQIVLVGIGMVLVLSPETLIDNVNFGVAPTWSDFALGRRGRDDRLHRDRDDLQHGRGGQGRPAHDPARRRPGGAGGARPIPADPGRRPLRNAGRAASQRRLRDRARLDLRRRPDPRHRREPRPRRRPHGGDALLRRRSRRGDPADRDQRGVDRRLATHLLDGPAPPASRAAAPGPSPLPHPLRRDPRLLGASRRSP